MFCKFRPVTLLCWVLGVAVMLGFAGACSPEHYRADADKEVYKIIDDKWQDDFGIKANYTISDSNDPASPNDVEIAEMIPESRVINLQQAVEIATKFNRDYQFQKESLYSSALSLTDTRHDYAYQWLGTIDAAYINEGENASGVIEEGSVDSQLEVSKDYLLADGIQVSTNLALNWIRYLTGDPHTSLGSVLNATVAVPLLGAGAGRQARERLTQAERNVLYDIRAFNRYRKTFVIDIINGYYGVLELRNSVSITEASYKRQVESVNQLKMEVEVGQKAPSEADEAMQSLLNAENNLIRERQSYEQALDEFKIQLSLPTDANVVLDQNELAALEAIGVSLPEYTEAEAIEMALARRLDLANTKDELDDASRRLALAADGLGIQLNLIGGANNIESPSGTDFSRLMFQQGDYSVGLGADLPLDRKSKRNEYMRALISFQRTQRGYDEEVENVKLGVRQAYRNLTETGESYRIQKVGVELARRRVEEQTLLLKYGRGVIRLLVETEDALVRAQNNLTSALVSHTIAKMRFFRDIGVLQVKPDGMWEQRTQ
jgi:outer membrane protein TolC